MTVRSISQHVTTAGCIGNVTRMYGRVHECALMSVLMGMLVVLQYACHHLGHVFDTTCKNSNHRVVKQYVVFGSSEGPIGCCRVTSSMPWHQNHETIFEYRSAHFAATYPSLETGASVPVILVRNLWG